MRTHAHQLFNQPMKQTEKRRVYEFSDFVVVVVYRII